MTGPYGEAAWAYRRAGWVGVLPLPPGAKGPVPRGFTGWAGVDPSGADITAWTETHAAGNIGLRLPRGVYGLDVDAYGMKTGAAALARLEAAWGPLPATWCVSSRDDAISGIRLFRGDPGPGRRWRDEPAGHGAGIEAIHFGHRYAVVWPSVHPETGRKYIWRDGGELPRVDELPSLPLRWVWELSEPGEVRVGGEAGHEETVETVSGWRTGDPCTRVQRCYDRAVESLHAARDGAALHPAANTALHELVNLGNEGHAGVRRALADHYSTFVEIREGRGGQGAGTAAAEWWRMVRGAVGKLPARREVCNCDQWSGVGLEFDAPWGVVVDPAPVDEAATGQDLPVDPAGAMLAEMLTLDQIASRPAPVPLVSGLLYLDTLTWLIGKSGSFKSFVAFDIAVSVAAGRPWAGRRTHEGAVLYVAAEGAGGMSLRVRAYRQHNGDELPAGFRMLPRPVQARSDQWAVLIEAARRLAPVLIVIDTQARVSVGLNENDNGEMGEFIDRVDCLRRATGACVLLVHHIGRHGEDARGASAIDGAQDTELKVERLGGSRGLRARLVVDKQKDAADDAAIEFTMTQVELGADPASGALSSLVVVVDEFTDPFPVAPWAEDVAPNQVVILSILRELFSEHGGTKAEVRAALRERRLRDSKWISNQFGGAWNALLKKDLIERVGTSARFVVVDAAAAGGSTNVSGNINGRDYETDTDRNPFKISDLNVDTERNGLDQGDDQPKR